MLSDTLQEGLESYGIGAKVRDLRLRKKMGLVELGRHTSLSAAMLSKIERGLVIPTLPTLLRIALVFSVGLEYFFTTSREEPLIAIVRKRTRIQLPERPGKRDSAYHFESLDFPAMQRPFNTYYAEFDTQAGRKLRLHVHEGVEFLYVVKGRLFMSIGDREVTLDVGDSLYFDASLPHGYRRVGNDACAALVVTAP
jgi:transcriptional regulator with XRE-family HTH domain